MHLRHPTVLTALAVGSTAAAAATAPHATIVKVRVKNQSSFSRRFPASNVRQKRVIRLNGVITEATAGTNYCDRAADNNGCGAYVSSGGDMGRLPECFPLGTPTL
jgi:hypothetical protein